jgi:hypothetical protein
MAAKADRRAFRKAAGLTSSGSPEAMQVFEKGFGMACCVSATAGFRLFRM